MRKTYYIATLLLFMGGSTLFAQDRNTKKADKHYDRLEYVKAAEEYKDLVEDGDGNPYVYKRLADSYYNLYNTSEAERYYAMYLEEATDAEGEAYYRYAQMLKANEKYEESKEAMREFASKKPNDVRARAFTENPDYLSKLLDGKEKFEIKSLEDLNTELSDFGGYEFEDKLYFVSARNNSRRKYGWNRQPTLDVYVASKVGDVYKDAELLEGEVNTKYHEGTVSITPDGQTMYFTRNDYTDGDYEKSSEGIGQLKVYSAKLVNGEWDDIQALPFNDSEFSTGHTALSPDGNTLYFSSDRPGGRGNSDLYKVTINGDGSFGEPENLGPGINTPGRESFPFVDSEGTLYFSSDGQMGLGGLDVFYAHAEGDGFSSVKNLGKPVNSTGDDFAFFFDVNKEEGFVSSNRGGIAENVANDNIYKVTQVEPLEEIMLAIQVVDEETGEPIADATVIIYDDEENEVDQATTTQDGEVDFTLGGGVDYTVQVNAENYESNSELVSKDEEAEVDLTVQLSPIVEDVTEDIDLNPILFDFDESEITAEAAFELDRIIETLKKYPQMAVLVESHTDSRGSAEYNQALSERRAEATVQYMIENGIDESRISSEGLGESQPKNDCGQDCTEEEHHENRRSEFTLSLKID